MTQKPNDQMLESLSALTDGEASELELRRILKGIEKGHDQGKELAQTWRRYHIAGALMRKDAQALPQIDVSAGVAAAIAAEEGSTAADQQIKSGGQGAQSSWRVMLGKSMVAASVAAVMVVGLGQVGGLSQVAGVEGESEVAALELDVKPSNAVMSNDVNAASLGFDIPLPEARTVSTQSLPANNPYLSQSAQQLNYQGDDLTDVETQELLNRLLIQHANRASANGSLGLMPFARVSKMEDAAAQ